MTLEELEEIFMNGFADDQVGDAGQGPVNHVYRIGSQLVETTSAGNQYVHPFSTEAVAIAAMDELHACYSAWERDDTGDPASTAH